MKGLEIKIIVLALRVVVTGRGKENVYTKSTLHENIVMINDDEMRSVIMRCVISASRMWSSAGIKSLTFPPIIRITTHTFPRSS